MASTSTTSYQRSPRCTLRLLSCVFGLVFLTAACSAGTATNTSDSTNNLAAETTSPASAETATDSTATAGPSKKESEWRGKETESFPADGETLSVVGVRFDDILNVRTGPGAEHEILTSAPSTGSVVATGEAWMLPDGIWYQVVAGDETGWSSSSFLTFSGPVDDATDEIRSSGGPYTAETLRELGLLVAETQASDDIESKITLVSDPDEESSTEITVDVRGMADDAVEGFRLNIVGEFSENGKGIDLSSVQRTTLCTRGLSDGLCA